MWWGDAQYHKTDCNWKWPCLVNLCAFHRTFLWPAWTRSEGWWLILGYDRKTHYGLKFGGMIQYTMRQIIIWNVIYLSAFHYSDVIMGMMASLITSLMSVYSTVHPGADQRKHQSSASLAFVRRIHRRPVNSPHKWPVTRKMFPFDDVIMWSYAVDIWSVLCILMAWCFRTRSSGVTVLNVNLLLFMS